MANWSTPLGHVPKDRAVTEMESQMGYDKVSPTHPEAWQAASVAKGTTPSHPPQVNSVHICVNGSKCQAGMAASHGPGSG